MDEVPCFLNPETLLTLLKELESICETSQCRYTRQLKISPSIAAHTRRITIPTSLQAETVISYRCLFVRFHITCPLDHANLTTSADGVSLSYRKACGST